MEKFIQHINHGTTKSATAKRKLLMSYLHCFQVLWEQSFYPQVLFVKNRKLFNLLLRTKNMKNNKPSFGITHEVINHIRHNDDDIGSLFFWTYYPPLSITKRIHDSSNSQFFSVLAQSFVYIVMSFTPLLLSCLCTPTPLLFTPSISPKLTPSALWDRNSTLFPNLWASVSFFISRWSRLI